LGTGGIMSYTLDGKIANQTPEIKLSGVVTCAKCCTRFDPPEKVIITEKSLKQEFSCASYIGTEHYIYEAKRGIAVVYCSKYCRNKHNHRFIK
jgi:hypothetical protein